MHEVSRFIKSVCSSTYGPSTKYPYITALTFNKLGVTVQFRLVRKLFKVVTLFLALKEGIGCGNAFTYYITPKLDSENVLRMTRHLRMRLRQLCPHMAPFDAIALPPLCNLPSRTIFSIPVTPAFRRSH